MALDYVVRTVKHDAALKRRSRTRTRTTRACLYRISCTRLNFPYLAFVFRCVGVSLQPAESPVFFCFLFIFIPSSPDVQKSIKD